MFALVRTSFILVLLYNSLRNRRNRGETRRILCGELFFPFAFLLVAIFIASSIAFVGVKPGAYPFPRRIWFGRHFVYLVVLRVVVIPITPVIAFVGVRLVYPFPRFLATNVDFERGWLIQL